MVSDNNMISLKTIIISFFLILFMHVWATMGSWYWIVGWLDAPMHFLGGLWSALVFFYLNQKFFKIPNRLAVFIMALSFVSLIGVFWEFFEFSLDNLFFLKKWGPFQGEMVDTMGDLFFDLVGGLSFLVLYFIVDPVRRG